MNASAGERAVKAVAKSYGEEKVIFIHADTSNYSQMLGNYQNMMIRIINISQAIVK